MSESPPLHSPPSLISPCKAKPFFLIQLDQNIISNSDDGIHWIATFLYENHNTTEYKKMGPNLGTGTNKFRGISKELR